LILSLSRPQGLLNISLKIVWNSVLYISLNESAICCIFWARNKVFWYGPNYRIELSELKPNVNLNIKLNLKQFFWVVRISFNNWGSHWNLPKKGGNAIS
jgi:hypothetical protein